MKKLLPLLFATVALTFAPAAGAQEALFDEARFGGTWAQPDWLDDNHTEDNQGGLNAQVLFKPINIDFLSLFEASELQFFHDLVNPRPTIGATVNFDKNGTSYVHAGLLWHFVVTDTFFLEGGLGGAWNNGSELPTATRAGIGSKWVFHESVAVGANISETMTLTVQWDHLSHRRLAGTANRGLNNVSARIGIKF